MMAAGTYTMPSSSRFVIWLIGVSFVLFQFFLQLSSGMVIGAIMHDMSFSALKAGILSSALYIVYTALQIPVGVLFDNKNTKKLLAINAFICGLGCLLFARSHTFAGLFFSRALIGMGSAFAFIGLSHLLRQHFPLKQFGFLIGVSETVGFIGTVIGIMGLGALINDWGWRGFINGAGMVGLLIAFSCWRYIPNNAPSTNPASYYYQQLFQILRNKKAWINGIFIALTFTVVTSFGALWAVPFIQVKLHCDLQKAGFLCALWLPFGDVRPTQASHPKLLSLNHLFIARVTLYPTAKRSGNSRVAIFDGSLLRRLSTRLYNCQRISSPGSLIN